MKKYFLALVATITFVSAPAYARVELARALELYDSIEALLAPRIAQKNIDIELDIKTTTYPGAYARWEKHIKKGIITLSPELLEMPEINPQTLSLLICHEFGHFLGGAPTITQNTDSATMARMMRNPFQNLSVEGQADFFATSSCYRELFEQQRTKEQMKDDLDQLVVVFERLMELQNIHVPTSRAHRDTPSIARASVTMSMAFEYPTLQCRLDTLLAGLDCRGVDEISGACQTPEIERPACWFKKEE